MTERSEQSVVAEWFRSELAQVEQLRVRTQASHVQLQDRFTEMAVRLETASRSVAVTQAGFEHGPEARVDIAATLARLDTEGPHALTGWERRALISQPDRVSVSQTSALLAAYPHLLLHLFRICLANWRAFCAEPWGGEYLPLLIAHARQSGLGLFEENIASPERLLARGRPHGPAYVAEALVEVTIGQAHEVLLRQLGLKNAWLYTAWALCGWLRRRIVHGLPLDEAARSIRADVVLRTMLLPAARGPELAPVSAVRCDDEVHGHAVAALFDAAFRAPALLTRSEFGALSAVLMRSSFGDPRIPPLSVGWSTVRKLAESSFRKFLASLAEQDLEIFFAHAMRERDRQLFWLGYLEQIERTGCVLDTDLQERLQLKFSGDESLQIALRRAQRFRRASPIQAFYLVFARHVVVEFSDKGHAAYVYRRDFFERQLEAAMQKGRVDAAGALKLKAKVEHRILHGGQWQSKTAQWLASQGIHAKARS